MYLLLPHSAMHCLLNISAQSTLAKNVNIIHISKISNLWLRFCTQLIHLLFQAGGSSPWLSEFETFLGKMDNDNLARATVPKLPQQLPPLQTLDSNSLQKPSQQQPLPPIQGGQHPQQNPQPTSESQQGQNQLIPTETERSIAWRVPLLRFIIETRVILNVATSDDRVRQTVLFGRQDKLSTFVKSRRSFLITRVTGGPIFRDFVLHQVQEGLVRLSKEHLCSEGGLPLSGLLILSFTGTISLQAPI